MADRASNPKPKGFTLIELLAVLAIIGVLVALLLPAVQAARESARNTQCKNHLRQIGVAMLHHEAAHSTLPAGGWSAVWIGDPNQGTGARQPGGWIFQTAFYLEQRPLLDSGLGQTGEALKRALSKIATQPIAVFNCPSRRSAKLYQSVEHAPANFVRTDMAAKTDYAANGGSHAGMRSRQYGPKPNPLFFIHSDCWRGFPDCDWANRQAWTGVYWNGVVGDHVGARLAQVTDGASHTMLVGEKWLYEIYYDAVSVDDPRDNQTNKHAADNPGDDGPMYIGYAYDNVRSVGVAESGVWLVAPPRRDSDYARRHAQQDKKGAHYRHCFGGPHPAGANTARCDGSVDSVAFEVDPEVWRRLGVRNDGDR